MPRLCVIGAGKHSQLFHLPALRHYLSERPGDILLAGVCDHDLAKAREGAELGGFAHAYADIDDMLRRERPDACLAITPVKANAATAVMLLRAGISVLMEKPLGTSLAEAREVVQVAAETGGRAMVSMNRRFDPNLRDALQWIGNRRLRYVRATMARHNRRETAFLEETGLHVVDLIRMVVGQAYEWKAWTTTVNGVQWGQARLEFPDRVYGLIDFLPTAGGPTERLELFGDEFRVEVSSAEFDEGGWRAWANGRLVCEKSTSTDTPAYIANGTYAETVAFLDGLREDRPLMPSPADVLPSMELCHAIAASGMVI